MTGREILLSTWLLTPTSEPSELPWREILTWLIVLPFIGLSWAIGALVVVGGLKLLHEYP